MTNIKNFDLNSLSIDQISFKFKNIDSSNSLYLVFNNVDAYIEESNENKYLVFPLKDQKKEALENYTELWDKTFE